MKYLDRIRDRTLSAGMPSEFNGRTKKLAWAVGGPAMLPVIAALMVLALVGYGETLNAFGFPSALPS
jgi:hypothetical protein